MCGGYSEFADDQLGQTGDCTNCGHTLRIQPVQSFTARPGRGWRYYVAMTSWLAPMSALCLRLIGYGFEAGTSTQSTINGLFVLLSLTGAACGVWGLLWSRTPGRSKLAMPSAVGLGLSLLTLCVAFGAAMVVSTTPDH